MEAINFIQTDETKPLAIVELTKEETDGMRSVEFGIVLGRDEVMPVRYASMDEAKKVIMDHHWELIFNVSSWIASQAIKNKGGKQ